MTSHPLHPASRRYIALGRYAGAMVARARSSNEPPIRGEIRRGMPSGRSGAGSPPPGQAGFREGVIRWPVGIKRIVIGLRNGPARNDDDGTPGDTLYL